MTAPSSPLEVRRDLIDALQLDLIGPSGDLGDPREVLSQPPSRWYLTGFLVPTDADEEQKFDPTSSEDVDQAPTIASVDENEAPEKTAARRTQLPSSMGVSVLLPSGIDHLNATVRYGLYVQPDDGDTGSTPQIWQRISQQQTVSLNFGRECPAKGEVRVPDSGGVELVWSLRGVPEVGGDGGLPPGTRSLSVFVVNRRHPGSDEERDLGFIFQVELELRSDHSFVARPNLHSAQSDDWDERVADLQYRDAFEFSVGHNVATEAVVEGGECRTVRTCWLPKAEVEKVAPSKIPGVTLRMEALASLSDGEDAQNQLGNLVTQYRLWIDQQAATIGGLPPRRQETARELLHRAEVAAERIQAGIDLLSQPDCVTCANRHCEFSRGNYLPILSVDEPIYRRLPCFLIATVDKFAAMPWTGEVGGFFGRVERADEDGFYGPCQKSTGRPLPVDRLPPPDLVIQDELHLISGPLGTMVGLYETALDALSTVEIDGKPVRPMVVASTATVRRARNQIRSLFGKATRR